MTTEQCTCIQDESRTWADCPVHSKSTPETPIDARIEKLFLGLGQLIIDVANVQDMVNVLVDQVRDLTTVSVHQSAQIVDLADALMAIQMKLGVDESSDPASVDFRLSQLEGARQND